MPVNRRDTPQARRSSCTTQIPKTQRVSPRSKPKPDHRATARLAATKTQTNHRDTEGTEKGDSLKRAFAADEEFAAWYNDHGERRFFKKPFLSVFSVSLW